MTKSEVVRPRPVEIIELTPDGWQVLKDLKLKSMKQEPIAFEDYDEGIQRYEQRSEEQWREKLDSEKSHTFTVFAKGEENYVGMVSALLDPEEKKALVQHMYVDSEGYRGQGVGKKLLVALIEKLKAEPGIEKAELAVLETQTAAIALYESLGFVKVREVSVKRSGANFTEYEMERKL